MLCYVTLRIKACLQRVHSGRYKHLFTFSKFLAPSDQDGCERLGFLHLMWSKEWLCSQGNFWLPETVRAVKVKYKTNIKTYFILGSEW